MLTTLHNDLVALGFVVGKLTMFADHLVIDVATERYPSKVSLHIPCSSDNPTTVNMRTQLLRTIVDAFISAQVEVNV